MLKPLEEALTANTRKKKGFTRKSPKFGASKKTPSKSKVIASLLVKAKS